MEIRYLPKNYVRLKKLIEEIKNIVEVFSILETNHYICLLFKSSITIEVIRKIKSNEYMYFVYYFKI